MLWDVLTYWLEERLGETRWAWIVYAIFLVALLGGIVGVILIVFPG